MTQPRGRGDWTPPMPLVAVMGYAMGAASTPLEPWTLTEVVAIAVGFHLLDQLLRRLRRLP